MSFHDGVELYDASELELAKTCWYKYYCQIVKKRRAVTSSKKAAEFGQAMHHSIQHYFKTGDLDESIRVGENYYSPFDDGSDDKRTVGRVAIIMEAYATKYNLSAYQLLDIERGFIIPIHEDIMYCGRLDMRVQEEATKRIFPWDIKTTGDIFTFLVKPNDQFSGYIWADQEMFSDTWGIMVDLVGVYKSKPAKGKRGEYLAGKSPDDCLVRIPTTRTKGELDRWKADTLDYINQVRSNLERNTWPRNSSACRKYNVLCEYYIVCTNEPSISDILLEDNDLYREDPWVPYPELYQKGEADGNKT